MDDATLTCPHCSYTPPPDEAPEFEHPDDAWQCPECGEYSGVDELFG